jgi:hypothetical protein
MKYEIEQMRRHPSIQGYVITEFTDLHWECNGLLDMCRNPKVYYDRFHTINADTVIVPEWERLAFNPGETCQMITPGGAPRQPKPGRQPVGMAAGAFSRNQGGIRGAGHSALWSE